MGYYEPLEPTLVPNTTMKKWFNDDGIFQVYRTEPNEGYVLHVKGLDHYSEYDEETGEGVGDPILGYRTSASSTGYNYDWQNTKIIDGYTAYGRSEYFARPIGEVSGDQIFADIDNNHEVM